LRHAAKGGQVDAVQGQVVKWRGIDFATARLAIGSNKMKDGHEQGEAGDRGGDWRVMLCRGVKRDDGEGGAGDADHRCLAAALPDEWHIDELRLGALPIALRRRAPDRLPQSSYQVDMVSWHR